MQVVILAGGRGTRLSPITDLTPKPMVLIKNKPFLEYLLLMLRKNSFKKVLICVGYLGDKIEAYFGNGCQWDIEIKYSYEKDLLGTAGALKLANSIIEEKFLLIYGDSYLDIDYGKFIEFFENKKTIGAIAIYDNSKGDTSVKNNIAIMEDSIIKYDKNKEDACLKYVEAGAAVFNKRMLNFIEENKCISLENDIFPLLIRSKELSGYKSQQRFYDIGTFDRLSIFQNFKVTL